MTRYITGSAREGRWWSHRLVRFPGEGVDGGDFFVVCEVHFDGQRPVSRTDGADVCGDTIEEANKARVMLFTAFKFPPIDNSVFEPSQNAGDPPALNQHEET